MNAFPNLTFMIRFLELAQPFITEERPSIVLSIFIIHFHCTIYSHYQTSQLKFEFISKNFHFELLEHVASSISKIRHMCTKTF